MNETRATEAQAFNYDPRRRDLREVCEGTIDHETRNLAALQTGRGAVAPAATTLEELRGISWTP